MITKKISVIVPIYKVESYLCQCVDSILAQSYQNIEVLLIDDGSPDLCGKICDDYAAMDDRVIVIHKINEGLSSARNTGIKRATGEYLVFVDSDDFIAPDMLETLYNRAIETNAQLTICNIQYVDETGNPLRSGDPAKEYQLPEKIWNQQEFWEQKRKRNSPVYVVAWNKLYQKNLFKSINYPVGKIHEDEFVLHYIIDQCTTIASVSKQLYYYRQRSGSITTTKVDPHILDKQEAYLARSKYFYKKKNYKMVQATVLEMIDLMEWFAYESERAGAKLPDCYEPLKKELIQFTRQPIHSISPVYWCITQSYRLGIFPYKFIRNLYWSFVRFRKKLQFG